MTPAEPIWLLMEVLTSMARIFRDQKRRRSERRRVARLLPKTSSHPSLARLGLTSAPRNHEPDQLPDPLYARVQASLLEFARKRDIRRTEKAMAAGARLETGNVAWEIRGREVVVSERRNALFRAVWSAREGGWRLFWSQSPERWWPYVPGTHLSMGSFESCVKEVERDHRGCFLSPRTMAPARG